MRFRGYDLLKVSLIVMGLIGVGSSPSAAGDSISEEQKQCSVPLISSPAKNLTGDLSNGEEKGKSLESHQVIDARTDKEIQTIFPLASFGQQTALKTMIASGKGENEVFAAYQDFVRKGVSKALEAEALLTRQGPNEEERKGYQWIYQLEKLQILSGFLDRWSALMPTGDSAEGTQGQVK